MLLTQPGCCSSTHRLAPMPDDSWFAHARIRRVWRFAALLIAPLLFVLIAYTPAAAQIVIDGNIAEPDWHLLGTSAGGPAPGFGPGNEINALYADIDPSYFYIAVAGNVQWGNRILVFIDSRPGGYSTGNFGRFGAPPGLVNFNSGTVFDVDFFPDYVLVIGPSIDGLNNTWDLYTLSGSVGVGGGPNLYLGDRNDADLGAAPANSSITNGFEARLTYSSTGAGVDLMISQSYVQLFAMYISEPGFLSNQFISRAAPGAPNFGNGAINFSAATPNPVYFTHFFVINEVDYTQAGNDNGEFVELRNITNLTLNLDPYQLRFVNGFGGGSAIYRIIDLPSFTMAPGQYFVVCGQPANVPNCNLDATPDTGLLENALPSAVALVFQPTDTLVDTVSYGGNTGAPYTEVGGVSVSGEETTPGLGISRIPDGMDTNRNFVDFSQRCITPGQFNSAQNTNCAPGVGTPTWTPTWTPTPTPSVTVTPLPTLPASCVNMLVNGDFESDGGWDWMFGQSPIPGKYTSTEKHGGLRAAQLGDPADPNTYAHGKASYSSIRQLVHIPHGYSIAQLRWWHYYKTEEPTVAHPQTNSDRQEVILLTPSGHTLKVLHRVLRNDGAWQQESVDITEFRGRSFYVYFNVFNDGNKQRTWMYLDDVMVEACPPNGNGGSATPTGSMTPTPTPTVTPTPSSTPSMTPIVQFVPPAATATLIAQAPLTAQEPLIAQAPPPTWTPFPSTFLALLSPTPPPTLYPTAVAAASTSAAPTSAAPTSVAPTVGVTPAPVVSSEGVVVLSRPPNVPTTSSSRSAPSMAAEAGPTAVSTFAPALAVGPDVANQASSPPAAPGTPTPSIVNRADPNGEIGRGCVDWIVNGDFEAIGPGWTLSHSPAVARYAPNPQPNSASGASNQSLELGIVDGINVASISAVEQTIQLPVAQSIILNFHFYPLYDATPGPGDLQYVDIFHAETGAFVGRALSAQQNDRVWLARSYDITHLAGEPIRLVFAVNNDGVQGRTAMYVDNVALLACNFGPDIAPVAVAHPTPSPRPISSQPVAAEAPVSASPRVSSLSLVTTPTMDNSTAQDSLQESEERAQPWAVALGAITLWAGIVGVLGISFLAVLNAFRSS